MGDTSLVDTLLRDSTPKDKGGVSTLEELAVSAVVSTEVIGKEGLECLEDDPSYLVCANERFDSVPSSLVDKVIARTEAVKAGLVCDGTGYRGFSLTCSALVSPSFCALVQEYSGVEEWHKCRACTCPCMYDSEFALETDACNQCLKDVCVRCGEGCVCSER